MHTTRMIHLGIKKKGIRDYFSPISIFLIRSRYTLNNSTQHSEFSVATLIQCSIWHEKIKWLVPLIASQLLQYGPNEMQGAGHADEAWSPASALQELGGSDDQVRGERRAVLAPDHHGLSSGTRR